MPAHSDPERAPLLGSNRPSEDEFSNVNVYSLVHSIHEDVKLNIDSSLSWEQLNAPDVNFSVLRPMIATYTRVRSPAIIYALLLNRVQFLRLADSTLSFASLQRTRADLCELLSIKLARVFASTDLELVDVLSRSWNPYAGAPESVSASVDMSDVEDDMQNALELAITSQAKFFLSTPLLQRVISLIHSGTIVYHQTLSSKRALLSDNYKSKRIRDRERQISGGFGGSSSSQHGVYLYDARDAGWLDTARLKVPFWRDVIEMLNFALLFVAFVTFVRNQEHSYMNASEIIFILFALGLALDEFAATKEHGFAFYSQSLFNGFDTGFLLIFFTYLGLRIRGLVSHDTDHQTSQLAFDTLACSAALLFPRLAFTVISGNVILVALKKMLQDFAVFMGFAVICFTGIFWALLTLGKGTWTARSILWLMARIWFGSMYLSFDSSASFHPIYGPILLIAYGALCSTLLLTILISILSNRYSYISTMAKEESAFQAAVGTIGGVKSDAIFSFIIPLNISAALILGPLNYVLTPRAFHRATVFLVRLSTFPLLLSISFYERARTRKLFSLARTRVGSAIEDVVGALVGSGTDWVDAVFSAEGLSDADGSGISLSARPADLEREISRSQPGATLAGWPPTPTRLITSEPESVGESSSSRPPPTLAQKRTSTRKYSPTDPGTDATGPGSRGSSSPLARLFGRGIPEVRVADEQGRQLALDADALAERVTAAAGGAGAGVSEAKQRELLREELAEMKERQERIESLLLVLTKGIRSDSM